MSIRHVYSLLNSASDPEEESIKHTHVKESAGKNLNVHLCVHFHSEQQSSRYLCLKSLHLFDFWALQPAH